MNHNDPDEHRQWIKDVLAMGLYALCMGIVGTLILAVLLGMVSEGLR